LARKGDPIPGEACLPWAVSTTETRTRRLCRHDGTASWDVEFFERRARADWLPQLPFLAAPLHPRAALKQEAVILKPTVMLSLTDHHNLRMRRARRSATGFDPRLRGIRT